jgi:small-conductance mechanosensitive channel
LAVALALQDTLANFFAGVHILVEEPISLGDVIRLSTNEEGTVTDIGWRTTRVLTGQNNTIVIPNTKITSGILVNYSLPGERVVTSVAILVGHTADPDRVAAIALEEARRIPTVLHEPAPSVAMDPGVLLTHTQLRLDVSVPRFANGGAVQSELRAALFRRFREDGIPLPEPPPVRAGA